MLSTADHAPPRLEIRLLGPLEIRREGEPVALPRSKKTRALLAYLATSEKEHSRDRLCALFWELTDDPRGALRWSLSKLRRVVDDETVRIVADRQRVAFVPADTRVDGRELTDAVARGVGALSTAELERLAAMARGEFLEDLELPDLFEFQAWCVARRESAREARCAVLGELVQRHREDPRRALPFARAQVQADVFGVATRIQLLEILLRAGRTDEARQQLELSRRLFREVGALGASDLEKAWRALEGSRPEGPPVGQATPEQPAPPPGGRPIPPADRFVGRRAERARLGELLEQVRAGPGQRVVLVTGEPGAGKSRLAEVVLHRAREAGVEVLAGRAYEAETTRPFGPWTDALGADIALLVPEPGDRSAPTTREGLFAAVADAVATRTTRPGGAILFLDDIQWLDRDSAELLHFVTRVLREHPLLVLLVARRGELADNEPALRAVRSLRRAADGETIDLAPMSPGEIGELVAHAGVDGEQIHRASAGNPLYALELARAAASGVGEPPSSLVELVRERIERLPSYASELLRWGAVLGHTLDLARLEALSSLEPNELVLALEQLEGHELIRSDPRIDHRYGFAHDVVRQAVYAELSHPRRRLMHRQVARLLKPEAADSSIATEVAHHASLAGDALLGARACVLAGRHSLRVCANGDAEALARRGLELVDELDDPERIGAALDLLHILYSARTPDRDRAAARVQRLAEEALDLGLTREARLGFQMLSFLRWESASLADAHDKILQAERVSRSAGPGERSAALAQAARCLVLLERDLAQAEAFLLEAELLENREGGETSAVPFATAMLHRHRGELDEAARAFRRARWVGREQGDRLAEFRAIEQWTMLEIDRGRRDQALPLATELAALGERLRQGAEGPIGRALLALVRHPHAVEGAETELAAALDELRRADAKYEIAFVLTRLARLALDRGDHRAAARHATEGLEVATAVGRATDVVFARVLLAQCAEALGDRAAVDRQLTALAALRSRDLAAGARDLVDAELERLQVEPPDRIS